MEHILLHYDFMLKICKNFEVNTRQERKKTAQNLHSCLNSLIYLLYLLNISSSLIYLITKDDINIYTLALKNRNGRLCN